MDNQSQLKDSPRLATNMPRGGFIAACGLLFISSIAATIYFCRMMSGGMYMPGGWTMSMMWMRMSGQTWPGVAAKFLGIWVVMMIAMMMPSLVPMLLRYQRAVNTTEQTRLNLLTALVGVGYYVLWVLFGIAAFGLGLALATFAMQQPALAHAMPLATGAVVLVAGALQFTTWKTYHLTSCRATLNHDSKLPADAGMAWRHGLRLGLHCCYCCFSLMVILLAVGMMDLRAMAVVTIAITVERFLPSGKWTAVIIGGFAVLAGLFLFIQAAGIG
jgi:predicted metal-binding membrane protein